MAGLVLAIGLLAAAGAPRAAEPARFDLSDLRPGRMTLRGHYGAVDTVVTFSVAWETCRGRPCIHALWDSAVKKIDMRLRPDGRPIRTHYEHLAEGRRVDIEYTQDGATYRHTEHGETEVVHIDEDGLLEVLAIDLLFLGYPFERGGEIEFSGIDADSGDGDTYGFEVERDGIETLELGGRKVRAYRLEFEVTGFAGAFAPTFHFWYTVEPPRRYLGFRGNDNAFFRTAGDLAVGGEEEQVEQGGR